MAVQCFRVQNLRSLEDAKKLKQQVSQPPPPSFKIRLGSMMGFATKCVLERLVFVSITSSIPARFEHTVNARR